MLVIALVGGLLNIPLNAFAADTSLWTKTYKAEDGSILTITCMDEEEGGLYTIKLDGKVYSNAFYDGLGWHLMSEGKSNLSLDGKLSFNGGQLVADIPDEQGFESVGNEEGILLQSDNKEDTNFYLAKFDEKKNAEDSSTIWYKIVKTYKLIIPNVTAVPTSSKVLVNGKNIHFEAYNIDSSNYFKLRDLAQALSGSEKQFEVTWDSANNAINLISGKAYTTVGGELAIGSGKTATATLSSSVIYKDSEPIDLTAYTINGNNYFKLRDIGTAFGVDVKWDSTNNMILIDTGDSDLGTVDYTGAQNVFGVSYTTKKEAIHNNWGWVVVQAGDGKWYGIPREVHSLLYSGSYVGLNYYKTKEEALAALGNSQKLFNALQIRYNDWGDRWVATKMESNFSFYYKTAKDAVKPYPKIPFYYYHEDVDAWTCSDGNVNWRYQGPFATYEEAKKRYDSFKLTKPNMVLDEIFKNEHNGYYFFYGVEHSGLRAH